MEGTNTGPLRIRVSVFGGVSKKGEIHGRGAILIHPHEDFRRNDDFILDNVDVRCFRKTCKHSMTFCLHSNIKHRIIERLFKQNHPIRFQIKTGSVLSQKRPGYASKVAHLRCINDRYLLPLKNSFISRAHSSSSTPPVTVALGCMARGAYSWNPRFSSAAP